MCQGKEKKPEEKEGNEPFHLNPPLREKKGFCCSLSLALILFVLFSLFPLGSEGKGKGGQKRRSNSVTRTFCPFGEKMSTTTLSLLGGRKKQNRQTDRMSTHHEKKAEKSKKDCVTTRKVLVNLVHNWLPPVTSPTSFIFSESRAEVMKATVFCPTAVRFNWTIMKETVGPRFR